MANLMSRDFLRLSEDSFFDKLASGGDAYLLSHVIHDWSEEQCLTILGKCRQAMNPRSRLLIIDMMFPLGILHIQARCSTS